jgi:hypothetical protein
VQGGAHQEELLRTSRTARDGKLGEAELLFERSRAEEVAGCCSSATHWWSS